MIEKGGQIRGQVGVLSGTHKVSKWDVNGCNAIFVVWT